MRLEGDLQTMPVREVLSWLGSRTGAGTLSLSRGMVVRRFHLSHGCVTLASSSEHNRLLGQLLLDHGLIDAAQLDMVLRNKEKYGERLGKALTLTGLVTDEQMAAVLREKVRDLLSDALLWADGRFVYDDAGEGDGRPVVPIFVDLRAFLDSAAVPVAVPPDASSSIIASDRDVIEAEDLS